MVSACFSERTRRVVSFDVKSILVCQIDEEGIRSLNHCTLQCHAFVLIGVSRIRVYRIVTLSWLRRKPAVSPTDSQHMEVDRSVPLRLMEYDRLTKLDPWKTEFLLKVKTSMVRCLRQMVKTCRKAKLRPCLALILLFENSDAQTPNWLMSV